MRDYVLICEGECNPMVGRMDESIVGFGSGRITLPSGYVDDVRALVYRRHHGIGGTGKGLDFMMCEKCGSVRRYGNTIIEKTTTKSTATTESE